MGAPLITPLTPQALTQGAADEALFGGACPGAGVSAKSKEPETLFWKVDFYIEVNVTRVEVPILKV